MKSSVSRQLGKRKNRGISAGPKVSFFPSGFLIHIERDQPDVPGKSGEINNYPK
jgi:hypothetical protein